MKKTYRVQRMTEQNYNEFMNGGYDYTVEKIEVEAESIEEAIAKASAEGYRVNENSIVTAEEAEKEAEAFRARIAENRRKEAEQKARREAKTAEKAAAAGMTVQQYKAEQGRLQRVRNTERKIAELEKALEEARAYLEHLKG